MKRQTCLFFIFSTILLAYSINCKNDENFRAGTRFKSIKCESNTTLVIIRYCFIKPVSRQVVTLNIGTNIILSIGKPSYVRVIVNYRYGTIFRQVLDTHPIEWCGLMEGTTSHPLINLIVQQIKGSAPDFFRKCPYFGEMDVKNMTIDRSKNVQKSSIFPEGTYRGELSFTKDDIQIFKVTLSFELKSALKESFGR